MTKQDLEQRTAVIALSVVVIQMITGSNRT